MNLFIHRPLLIGACAVSLVLSVLCSAAEFPFGAVRVATGLARPVFVTALPSHSNLVCILEQHTGRIKLFDVFSHTLHPTPFLELIDLSVGNEQGLLGLAFHPGYSSNGFLFVNYTDRDGRTHVRRYTVSGDPLLVNTNTPLDLLLIAQPFSNHNGGWLGFGPDGYLYISTGDGGAGNDPANRAQTITDMLLGKLLRLDVDSTPAIGKNYAIPAGNPFVGIDGDDEIWAYGLRNPWRCSFDRETGDLWIGDVGQNAREEIDFQPAASTGGENYGWRAVEGTLVTGLNTNVPANAVAPVHEYTHSIGFSISGGYMYRGTAIPGLTGTYFFADYVSDNVWSFRFNGTASFDFTDRTAQLVPDAGTLDNISSFGEDSFGELYICDLTDGDLFKIIQIPEGGITALLIAGIYILRKRF
jgi:glucose/arabinose dehydrogenase